MSDAVKIFTPDDSGTVAVTQCVAMCVTEIVWLLAADAQAWQGPSLSHFDIVQENDCAFLNVSKK